MRQAIRTGISFGLASATITTLGLMVGLRAGTDSRAAVIGGVLIIAIADALSDALGIHFSEEAENVHTEAQIWASTVATLASKLLVGSSFLVPLLLLPLGTAVVVNLVWGLVLLSLWSWHLARITGKRPALVIAEHVGIATAVVASAHHIGRFVRSMFG